MSDTDNYAKQFIRSIQEEPMYSYWYAEYKTNPVDGQFQY